MGAPVIYAAGPITGLSYAEATLWRNQLIELLYGFTVLSPMRGKEALADVEEFGGEYPDHLLCDASAIITRDLNDVMRSNVIVVKFVHGFKMSIGTPIEVGMSVALNKPIVSIVHPEDAYRKHPFFMGLPRHKVVETEEQAAFFVRSLYPEVLKPLRIHF